MWVVVTGKQKDGTLLGQGKLRWLWNDKEWQFDALSSYVNYGIGFGDSEPMSIGELIDKASKDKTGDAEEVFGQ